MDYSGDMADKIGTGECGEILIYRTENGQTNIEVKMLEDSKIKSIDEYWAEDEEAPEWRKSLKVKLSNYLLLAIQQAVPAVCRGIT